MNDRNRPPRRGLLAKALAARPPETSPHRQLAEVLAAARPQRKELMRVPPNGLFRGTAPSPRRGLMPTACPQPNGLFRGIAKMSPRRSIVADALGARPQLNGLLRGRPNPYEMESRPQMVTLERRVWDALDRREAFNVPLVRP